MRIKRCPGPSRLRYRPSVVTRRNRVNDLRSAKDSTFPDASTQATALHNPPAVPPRNAPESILPNGPHHGLTKYTTGLWSYPSYNRPVLGGDFVCASKLYTRGHLTKSAINVVTELKRFFEMDHPSDRPSSTYEDFLYLFRVAAQAFQSYDNFDACFVQVQPPGALIRKTRNPRRIASTPTVWSLTCALGSRKSQLCRPLFNLQPDELGVARFCHVVLQREEVYIAYNIGGYLKPLQDLPPKVGNSFKDRMAKMHGDYCNEIIKAVSGKRFLGLDALRSSVQMHFLKHLPTSEITKVLDLRYLEIICRTRAGIRYTEAVLLNDDGTVRDITSRGGGSSTTALTNSTTVQLPLANITPRTFKRVFFSQGTLQKLGSSASRIALSVTENGEKVQIIDDTQWNNIQDELEHRCRTSVHVGLHCWFDAVLATQRSLPANCTLRTRFNVTMPEECRAHLRRGSYHARTGIWFPDTSSYDLRLDTPSFNNVPSGTLERPDSPQYLGYKMVLFASVNLFREGIEADEYDRGFPLESEAHFLFETARSVIARICQEMHFESHEARMSALSEALLRVLQFRSSRVALEAVQLHNWSDQRDSMDYEAMATWKSGRDDTLANDRQRDCSVTVTKKARYSGADDQAGEVRDDDISDSVADEKAELGPSRPIPDENIQLSISKAQPATPKLNYAVRLSDAQVSLQQRSNSSTLTVVPLSDAMRNSSTEANVCPRLQGVKFRWLTGKFELLRRLRVPETITALIKRETAHVNWQVLSSWCRAAENLSAWLPGNPLTHFTLSIPMDMPDLPRRAFHSVAPKLNITLFASPNAAQDGSPRIALPRLQFWQARPEESGNTAKGVSIHIGLRFQGYEWTCGPEFLHTTQRFIDYVFKLLSPICHFETSLSERQLAEKCCTVLRRELDRWTDLPPLKSIIVSASICGLDGKYNRSSESAEYTWPSESLAMSNEIKQQDDLGLSLRDWSGVDVQANKPVDEARNANESIFQHTKASVPDIKDEQDERCDLATPRAQDSSPAKTIVLNIKDEQHERHDLAMSRAQDSSPQGLASVTSNSLHRAFVALGSNIGDRIEAIEAACRLMDESGMRILRTSPLYETEPMYVKDQEKFLNGVCEIETQLTPIELLDKLQGIENGLGRVKLIDKGPRNIDLDILTYDNETIETERLTVPHRLMLEREFVLRPLNDIGGDYVHPQSEQTINHHFKKLPASKSPMHTVTPIGPSLEPLRTLDDNRQTRIMSILNLTPDSFSDGGANEPTDTEALKATILSHIAGGATIIDIGGQSSRPNAPDVTAEEEIARIIPAIEVIKSLPEAAHIAISVDTYRASVAEAAVRAGAHIINDISAGTLDVEMLPTIAKLGCTYIMMHMRGTPATMQNPENTKYNKTVVGGVSKELHARFAAAEQAGVRCWRIILDPGLGFAKTVEQNLALLRGLSYLTRNQLSNLPWLVGSSRKGFIGKVTGVEKAKDRNWGTAATVAIAVYNWADIVRVHDVKEMAQVVKMTDAIRNPRLVMAEKGED